MVRRQKLGGPPAVEYAFPVVAQPPNCDCTVEAPEIRQSASRRTEAAQQMPTNGGTCVNVRSNGSDVVGDERSGLERRFSRTTTQICSTACYAKTEHAEPLPRSRVDCIRACHQTRERMMETREERICFPAPHTTDLPRFQPKLDLSFDPNPFRGNCDSRPIRLDDTPAKVPLSDPPPLVSLFPQELRLGAPPNFFAECPSAPNMMEDEDCEPELPRRPLSPAGFKYPNLMATQEARGIGSSESYRRGDNGAIPNPCAQPIQPPFQRTCYPAFLEIDHGTAPFPIQGPPANEPRRYEDCDCDDFNQRVENTRYPDTLDIDHGAMHFPLRGPESYKRDNRGHCDGGGACGGYNGKTSATSDSNGRGYDWNYPIREPSPPTSGNPNGNRRDDDNEPGHRDRSALPGSAIEEQYQRMCQEMERDGRFCPESCNGRMEKQEEEEKQNNDFFCYRAEIVQQPWVGRQSMNDDCNCRPFR